MLQFALYKTRREDIAAGTDRIVTRRWHRRGKWKENVWKEENVRVALIKKYRGFFVFRFFFIIYAFFLFRRWFWEGLRKIDYGNCRKETGRIPLSYSAVKGMRILFLNETVFIVFYLVFLPKVFRMEKTGFFSLKTPCAKLTKKKSFVKYGKQRKQPWPTDPFISLLYPLKSYFLVSLFRLPFFLRCFLFFGLFHTLYFISISFDCSSFSSSKKVTISLFSDWI